MASCQHVFAKNKKYVDTAPTPLYNQNKKGGLRLSTIGSRIRYRREELGLSQDELGKKLGYKSRSSINKIELDQRNLTQSKIKAIADALETTPAYIMGWEGPESAIPAGFQPIPPMKKIPLVGQIACGEPITAEENIEDYVTSLHAWHADFALKCIGDSMEPKIKDGDIVAIRKQPTVENGQIAAVRIDTEATFRIRLILQPSNPDYEPIVLVGEEINRVAIEGKAVGLCRDL